MTAQHEQDGDWLFSDIGAVLTDADLAFMSQPKSYDPNDEIARQQRVRIRHALPENLSQTDVADLGNLIYAAVTNPVGNTVLRHENRAGLRAENRFLEWLGQTAAQRDDQTTKSVQEVLWRGHGLRGKFTAASLAIQKIVQH